jgi:hypothetical protein
VGAVESDDLHTSVDIEKTFQNILLSKFVVKDMNFAQFVVLFTDVLDCEVSMSAAVDSYLAGSYLGDLACYVNWFFGFFVLGFFGFGLFLFFVGFVN